MGHIEMERIIHFQDYVVDDPGDAPLKVRQLLTEEDFRKTQEEFGTTFQADMGSTSPPPPVDDRRAARVSLRSSGH